MLFVVTYRVRSTSEENEKRGLELFSNWQPPVEFKLHLSLADGTGMGVVEASDAAALIEATAPYGPYLEFRVTPALEIEQAVPVIMKAWAWRDSVK